MVYQRFLDSTDGRARNIEIRLDGDAVEPWNPYCEGLSTLVAEQVQTVELENGNEASFHVRAFVLPRREEFPDDHAATRARITMIAKGYISIGNSGLFMTQIGSTCSRKSLTSPFFGWNSRSSTTWMKRFMSISKNHGSG